MYQVTSTFTNLQRNSRRRVADLFYYIIKIRLIMESSWRVNMTMANGLNWTKISLVWIFYLYLAVIYIKPKTPTFDSENTFLKLKLDIAKFSSSVKVILTGDFNSRTGKLPDFITNNSTFVFPKSIEDIFPSDYSCDTCSERLSRDKIVNCQGKLLLPIETKSRILNGRLLGDSVGNFIYVAGIELRNFTTPTVRLFNQILKRAS